MSKLKIKVSWACGLFHTSKLTSANRGQKNHNLTPTSVSFFLEALKSHYPTMEHQCASTTQTLIENEFDIAAVAGEVYYL